MREQKAFQRKIEFWESNRTVEGFGVIDVVLDSVRRFELHRLVLNAWIRRRNHPAWNRLHSLRFSEQQAFVQMLLLKDCRHWTFRFRSVLDWLLVKLRRLIYGDCMLFRSRVGIADDSNRFWKRKKLFSFNCCDCSVRQRTLPGSFNPLQRWRFLIRKLIVLSLDLKATAGRRKLREFREIENFATEHFEGRTRIEWKLVLHSFEGCCGGKILSRQPQANFLVSTLEKCFSFQFKSNLERYYWQHQLSFIDFIFLGTCIFKIWLT